MHIAKLLHYVTFYIVSAFPHYVPYKETNHTTKYTLIIYYSESDYQAHTLRHTNRMAYITLIDATPLLCNTSL